MRNKLIISILLVVCILGSVANVFAAGNNMIITEVPKVKIIMDGVVTTYKDVPINVNSRTLLPLRELLVNLGVPNDSEHIVWNGQEQSVTVYKDTTKLYLKVGSNTAYVNDNPVQLDVAPVNYSKNQRVYIPLKFVSDTLGKKVVWDGSANAVLIREAAEFYKIKDIFDKSDAAMKDMKKCRMTMDVKADFNANQITMNMGIDASGEIDLAARKMHMLMNMSFLGMAMKTDMYYADNASYSQDPFTAAWVKQNYTADEYDKIFTEQSGASMPEATESLYAGLVASQGTTAGETVLKGDVYLKELFDQAMTENGNQDVSGSPKMEFDKCNMEIVIDNTTNLIKSLNMSISGTETVDKTQTSINMDINIAYSDFNGSFEVAVPKDVLDNATESTSGGF